MSSCVRKEVQDKALFRQLEGFVCASVCCGDDFTWEKLQERERGIIVCSALIMFGLLSNRDKVLRGGPTRLARAFAVLSGCVFFTRFSDNLGFLHFYFICQISCNPNSDLEFWSSFGSFCQLFLFSFFISVN